MPTLWEQLTAYRDEQWIPMHMPGHKRNIEGLSFLEAISADCDLTEIDGWDDLHHPTGVLQAAMAAAATLYGSEDCYFLINGSSGGILAGIRAATRRGDRVLVARNCHKSVYHAIELCGLRPTYLFPPLDAATGIYHSLLPEQIKNALQQEAYSLVILTSPTYEGVISDVAAIAGLCHAAEIPLFVDGAHGAHLGLSPEFERGAVMAGADLVVQSLHKTLPAPTQTAILHRQGSRISPERLRRELEVFQTSSPSYLLLAAIDGCIDLLVREGAARCRRWASLLEDFYRRTAPLHHLYLLHSTDCPANFAVDRGKLVVCTDRTPWSGVFLADELRKVFHIEVEMASERYLIAMTGLLEREEHLVAFADALIALDRRLDGPYRQPLLPALPMPECCCAAETALAADSEAVSPADAVGRISAAYLWAYPPGIPLAVPGERLSAPLLAALADAAACGLSLYGSEGENFRVVRGETNGNA